MKDFTIIIPTRNRPKELKRLLDSIFDNAYIIQNFNVIVGFDKEYDMPLHVGCEYLMFERGEFLTRDYINPMAAKAQGKYVWFLADDCEVVTKHWNMVAKNAIEAQKKSIFWADTFDSTRNFNRVGEFAGFPIISKKAIETLGFFFDPRIPNWGADKYTHHIYAEAGCVIDLSAIEIKHHHILNDETSRHVKEVYEKYGSGSDLNYTESINKLREAKEDENRRAFGQTISG